ncbi:unnamed protein product [Lathyrus oleraceus]
MAQLLMFAYSLFIFLSLFLVETSKKIASPCKFVKDCPQVEELVAKCVDGFCVYWILC